MDNVRKFIKKTIEIPFLEKVLTSNSYHLNEVLNNSFIESLSQLKKSDFKAYLSFMKYLSFFDYNSKGSKLESFILAEVSRIKKTLKLYKDVVYGYPHANVWSVDLYNEQGERKYFEYMNRYFDFFHSSEDILNLIPVLSQAFPYKHKKVIYEDILKLKEKLIAGNKKIHFYNICESNKLIGISIKGEKLLDASCFNKKREFYIQELKKSNSNALKNYAIYKLMKMGDLNSQYLSFL